MERNSSSLIREYQKKSGGFTLTEILVVIFIISLLGAVTFANYRQGGKMMALQRSAYKLAQDIRKAQEMAIAAAECCGGIIPGGGYGIYFKTDDWPITDQTEYTAYLYADTSGNERYNNGEEIETLSLEEEVKIKKVRDTDFVPNRKKFSVNFKPPDPNINMQRWDPGAVVPLSGDMEIILSLRIDPNKTKTIRINKAGLIEVQ